MKAAHLLGVVGTRGLFSSGSPGLDALLYGGLWRGAVHVLSGDSFAGKSLLALLLCRAIQRSGGTVLYCDTEGGFSQTFTTQLGLSSRGFYAIRGRVGEATFALCEKVAKNGAADLIVLDSIHGITSREELDAPKLHTGQHARDRLVSLGSQRLARAAEQGGAAVVMIHRYALSESVARCAPARFARVWLDVQRSSLQWNEGRVVEARCWVKSQRGGAFPRSIRGVLFTDQATQGATRPEGEGEMSQDDTIHEESPRRERETPKHHRRAKTAASRETSDRQELGPPPPRTREEFFSQGATEKRAAPTEQAEASPVDAQSSAAGVHEQSTSTTTTEDPPTDAQSSAAEAAPRAAGAARP